MAAIHFEARAIHVDSAFQIFKWIHLDPVLVEAHRYSAVIPQLCVKAAMLCGLELRTLLLVASLAHVAVPYSIFLIAAYVCRTPWIAVGSALAAVLCTRLTFYGIVLEANYLLCYPFLLAAIIHGPFQRTGSIRSLVAVLSALLLVLTVHPVGFLIAMFVFALGFVRTSERKFALATFFFLSFGWGLFSRMLLPPSGYETALYTSAFAGLSELSTLTTSASFDFLLGHTWRDTALYLPLWLLSMGLVVMLVRWKEWAVLSIFLVGFLGYTVVNVITYRAGEDAVMMEKNFVPLATLVALPLALMVERFTMRAQLIAFVLFVVVGFLQFRSISFASRPAKERLAHIRAVVQRTQSLGLHKVAISAAELDSDGLHIHWALAFETLLVSAVQGPSRSVTVMAIAADGPQPPATGVYLMPLEYSAPVDRLDKRYFRSLSGSYTLLSLPQ